MGVVELNIRIRDFKKPWLFHVLANLDYPCILGIDFIGGSKIILDFDRKSLAIQESQVEDIKVRIYRHRKCDETEIGTGNSDSGSLHDESSGFDRVQRRSNDSREGKKKGSEVKRELEEKGSYDNPTPQAHADTSRDDFQGEVYHSTITCMVPKAMVNDRRKNLGLSLDEFRGP
ncbi:uncharacterized protein TNCV_4749091 [Trichonephila clavipes]|nr:uncharacterized protein TNCV_4749091 [Trichonephila clavipes]